MSSKYLLLAESKMTVEERITRAKNIIIANNKSHLVIIIYRVHSLLPANKRVLETAPVNEFKLLLSIDNRRGLTPGKKNMISPESLGELGPDCLEFIPHFTIRNYVFNVLFSEVVETEEVAIPL